MCTIWNKATVKDLILNAENRKKDPDFWSTVDGQLSGTAKGPAQDKGGTIYHSYQWRSFPHLRPVQKTRPVPHVLDYPKEIPKAGDEGFVWPVSGYSGHQPDGWIRSQHPNRRNQADLDSHALQTECRPSTQAAAAADLDCRPPTHAGLARVYSAPAMAELGQGKDSQLEDLVEMARAEAARGMEKAAAPRPQSTTDATGTRPYSEPARAKSQRYLGGKVGFLLEAARAEAKRGAAARQLPAMRQHGQGTIIGQDRQLRREAAFKEQQRLRAAYSSMSR